MNMLNIVNFYFYFFFHIFFYRDISNMYNEPLNETEVNKLLSYNDLIELYVFFFLNIVPKELIITFFLLKKKKKKKKKKKI